MQRLEVSFAVRPIWGVVRRQMVNIPFNLLPSTSRLPKSFLKVLGFKH